MSSFVFAGKSGLSGAGLGCFLSLRSCAPWRGNWHLPSRCGPVLSSFAVPENSHSRGALHRAWLEATTVPSRLQSEKLAVCAAVDALSHQRMKKRTSRATRNARCCPHPCFRAGVQSMGLKRRLAGPLVGPTLPPAEVVGTHGCQTGRRASLLPACTPGNPCTCMPRPHNMLTAQLYISLAIIQTSPHLIDSSSVAGRLPGPLFTGCHAQLLFFTTAPSMTSEADGPTSATSAPSRTRLFICTSRPEIESMALLPSSTLAALIFACTTATRSAMLSNLAADETCGKPRLRTDLQVGESDGERWRPGDARP